MRVVVKEREGEREREREWRDERGNGKREKGEKRRTGKCSKWKMSCDANGLVFGHSSSQKEKSQRRVSRNSGIMALFATILPTILVEN